MGGRGDVVALAWPVDDPWGLARIADQHAKMGIGGGGKWGDE